MSIHKIGSDLVRPLPRSDVGAGGGKGSAQGAGSRQRPERADRVGFSEEGLALAAQARGEADEAAGQRLETIRQRIAGGFYDDPAVAEEVARRLLASWDLDVQ